MVPSLGAEPILPKEWIHEQAYDVLCQLAARVVGPERTRFVDREDGVLVRVAPLDGAVQIVAPAALRHRVLQIKYEPAASARAGGLCKYETMRRGFYWPSIVADVYYTVRQCSSCARDRIALQKRTTPLTLFPARAPLYSVALDLLGLPPTPRRGNLHILGMVDRFSK